MAHQVHGMVKKRLLRRHVRMMKRSVLSLRCWTLLIPFRWRLSFVRMLGSMTSPLLDSWTCLKLLGVSRWTGLQLISLMTAFSMVDRDTTIRFCPRTSSKRQRTSSRHAFERRNRIPNGRREGSSSLCSAQRPFQAALHLST